MTNIGINSGGVFIMFKGVIFEDLIIGYTSN